MTTWRRNRSTGQSEALFRFMSKVDVTEGCWLWQGGVSSTGYATFNPSPGKKVYAARWLLELLNGRPLRGKVKVVRTCGNALCVRPKHIETDPFWAQVVPDTDSDCWLWTGHRVKEYGRYSGVLAHRYSYEQVRGDIPAGLGLDHLCRTPACVNPWHAEPVTQAVNNERKTHPTDVPVNSGSSNTTHITANTELIGA